MTTKTQIATKESKVSRRSKSDVEAYRKQLQGKHTRPGHIYVTLLGLDVFEANELMNRVEKGFSFRTLENLRRSIGLAMSDLAELVSISPRTLSRRKEEGRLHPDESDRLLRLSRVFGKALELFEGDARVAREWLSAPQPALGGAIPLVLTKTDIGAREVENLIGRLEHGVFS
jgi:putative toxin-antitoxin system antitoxin component (TIGR02293 family)